MRTDAEVEYLGYVIRRGRLRAGMKTRSGCWSGCEPWPRGARRECRPRLPRTARSGGPVRRTRLSPGGGPAVVDVVDDDTSAEASPRRRQEQQQQLARVNGHPVGEPPHTPPESRGGGTGPGDGPCCDRQIAGPRQGRSRSRRGPPTTHRGCHLGDKGRPSPRSRRSCRPRHPGTTPTRFQPGRALRTGSPRGACGPRRRGVPNRPTGQTWPATHRVARCPMDSAAHPCPAPHTPTPPRSAAAPRSSGMRGKPGYDPAADDDEMPAHSVQLTGFWIGVYPVTNEQHARFMAETGQPAPPSFSDRRFNDATQPVVTVGWDDAAAFTRWLTGKLAGIHCAVEVAHDGAEPALDIELPLRTAHPQHRDRQEPRAERRGAGPGGPAAGDDEAAGRPVVEPHEISDIADRLRTRFAWACSQTLAACTSSGATTATGSTYCSHRAGDGAPGHTYSPRRAARRRQPGAVPPPRRAARRASSLDSRRHDVEDPIRYRRPS